MKFRQAIVIAASIIWGTTVVAQTKAEKKPKAGHCEKLEADGKTIDIDAKGKADCKAKGGKWNKAEKSDHDHTD